MKLIRFAPVLLLPIHFLVYLGSSSWGWMLFNFDAILLSFYFGAPFWWFAVYALFFLSKKGAYWSIYLSITISAIASIAAYLIFSLDIPAGTTVMSGEKVYVDAGTPSAIYLQSLIGQAISSLLGVVIGTPIFVNFLRSFDEKPPTN